MADGSIFHFWGEKPILNIIIIRIRLLIFEANLLSTLTFLFKPGSTAKLMKLACHDRFHLKDYIYFHQSKVFFVLFR